MYDWVHEAQSALLDSESAEAELSYASEHESERMRKLAGAYYTPADVADHFWAIFFKNGNQYSCDFANEAIERYTFVEPSVGAGALFFSLLKNLLLLGVPVDTISKIRANLVDINPRALKHIAQQIRFLEKSWEVKFRHLRLIECDFRDYDTQDESRPLIFFGNPPFVANQRMQSRWKNLFADFVEASLVRSEGQGILHYIVPLSLAFSRDYRQLRHILRDASLEISISHYDNIPDTLFKAGKPRSANSNKANSQRCSILTAFPADVTSILSTRLCRWSKSERSQFLSSVPDYIDVTDYNLDDQIPRPASAYITQYLRDSQKSPRISRFISNSSQYELIVSSVARNYIGFRDTTEHGGTRLQFESKRDFLVVLGALSSDVFLQYWLTVGDGFHVTKRNILNFPVSKSLLVRIQSKLDYISTVWQSRRKFEKRKLNSGKETRSYDFTSVAISLSPRSREYR